MLFSRFVKIQMCGKLAGSCQTAILPSLSSPPLLYWLLGDGVGVGFRPDEIPSSLPPEDKIHSSYVVASAHLPQPLFIAYSVPAENLAPSHSWSWLACTSPLPPARWFLFLLLSVEILTPHGGLTGTPRLHLVHSCMPVIKAYLVP